MYKFLMKLKKDFVFTKRQNSFTRSKDKTNLKLPWHPWWQRPYATGEFPNHIKKKKQKTFTLERIEIMSLTNAMYLFDMVWVKTEDELAGWHH